MQITQENLLDWIVNYRWMVETIEEARHRQSDTGYIGAKIAQYGVESSLPKASGGTSDPVFNEVSRRVMGVSQRIQRYEYKVQQVQQRISLVRGDREIEVLHRLLDGDSMRALAEIFKSPLEELWERVQEAQEKESEHEYYREFHKLDFTRKKIQHRVMCRKPKHLIKKIIR